MKLFKRLKKLLIKPKSEPKGLKKIQLPTNAELDEWAADFEKKFNEARRRRREH